MLRIAGLGFRYPNGHQALWDITFEVAAGERVALLGPNGAGKSTLLLHLNGILEGTGVIEVDGLHLERSTLPAIRRRVGLVFQDPDDQLFTTSLFEDVAFGPRYLGLSADEVARVTHQALESVGLGEKAHHSPLQLSGGEKKRGAIATVLSMSPQILALDEPTAGLDPRSRRQLLELLGNLPQAMLVSTHDLGLVRELTPRAILLRDGRILADGASAELLEDAELLVRGGLEPVDRW